MSVQFGKCNFDGRPTDSSDLEAVRPLLTPYGPDAEGIICKDGVAILYCAFRTTTESEKEQQPFPSASGAVITWDGRLDNREELIEQLSTGLSQESTDVEIVSTAYDQWGTKSFAKFIGDWAISIWNFKDRSLVLANDFIGTRHLYYQVSANQVTWCTILDPLILLARQSLKLDKEYVAGWLASFPASHLTPYVGIHAVPPCSFVRITKGRSASAKYWDFDPAKTTRYGTDREYEEHFRAVFTEAVRRRLRANAPVLAELSGGMDSSSIVCISDMIKARDPISSSRLNTLSYYDDHEPNWNERPYFTLVEQQRGRAGLHIDVGSQSILGTTANSAPFSSIPAAELMSSDTTRQVSAYLISNGHRVLLSGVGGDETLGGVPTPVPELADLLVRGELLGLAHQLKTWALNKRKPWLWLLVETIQEFLPIRFRRIPTHKQPPSWICRDLIRQYEQAFGGYETRLRLFGALPSFQENIRTLDGLRRQLACVALHKNPAFEMRYPYLDRSFLEFVYSVPRVQLLRPGQRRSLMRRAMTEIVPAQLIARRRKAFVSRAPMSLICRESAEFGLQRDACVSSSLGIVDSELLSETLERARRGQEIAIAPLLRLMLLERWLRSVFGGGFLSGVNEKIRARNGDAPILISAEKC
jgi:asparagine synthase (glutamine-hydrolysing)